VLVAGPPPEYAELAFRHTLSMLATVTIVSALVEHWAAGSLV
jgi:hypothetical protein